MVLSGSLFSRGKTEKFSLGTLAYIKKNLRKVILKPKKRTPSGGILGIGGEVFKVMALKGNLEQQLCPPWRRGPLWHCGGAQGPFSD